MASRATEQGHEPDLMTGKCAKCGARREQIDDNLFPICEPVTGSHRLAIIAVRDAAVERQCAARWARRRLEAAGPDAVVAAQEMHHYEDQMRALRESLDYLKGAEGEKPRLRLYEAILRA